MEKKLVNGVTISYLDESRKLAGDRWLVKLRCQATIPLQEWMRKALEGTDPQLVFCREQFGEYVTHEVVRERYFIAEGDKDQLFSELVQGLEDTVLEYLAREAFVRQLFAVRLAEFAERHGQQGWDTPVNEEEDDPGPADFSACFR